MLVVDLGGRPYVRDAVGAERDFRKALDIFARAGVSDGEQALSARLHLASMLDRIGREQEAGLEPLQGHPALSPERELSFLSDDEIRRLSATLLTHAKHRPRLVAVIRLLLLTRCRMHPVHQKARRAAALYIRCGNYFIQA